MNDSVSVWKSQWIGRCTAARVTARGREIDVLPAPDPDSADSTTCASVTARCLDHVAPTPGDAVLVVASDAGEAIAVGTLGAAPRAAARLESGFSSETDGSRLRLRAPDGSVALEIDTAEGVPRVVPGAADLVLDLEGRLQVRARSIEIRSKLGDVKIHANDDAIIEGERIRLN